MLAKTETTNERGKFKNGHNFSKKQAKPLAGKEDLEYQHYLLQHVSRTFALTIPQLPGKLQDAVANAYLLCRAADTIEDDPALSYTDKEMLGLGFVELLENKREIKPWVKSIVPKLGDTTSEYEKELIENIERIILISQSFDRKQVKAIRRCLKIMTEGMISFQKVDVSKGLQNMEELNRYCYYVAGVVGEMLTELFAAHSPEMAQNEKAMFRRAASFGQGLQMTNILKDIWDDLDRSFCWLPQDLFNKYNVDIRQLQKGVQTPAFSDGIQELIGIAHGHLLNAFHYTLMVPAKEKGIRKFCFWAIFMGVLTLRNINNKLDFKSGAEVKISRKALKRTILTTNMIVKNDFLLKFYFNRLRKSLPYQEISI